jgi:hypothetical protein
MKLEAKLNVDALSFETSHWSHESYWIYSEKIKNKARSNADGHGCKTHSPYSEYRNA